jgi:lambda family phage minor tail protein L
MSLHPDLASLVQQPAPGDLVELFVFDGTPIGASIFRYTAGNIDDEPVLFDGNPYIPIPINAEGFEYNGKGTLPTPTIAISNIENIASALNISYNDFVGATVIRIRTFKEFLDGQPGADPTAVFPYDIFTIERKKNQNKLYVEWELAASLDQQGAMLPGRQALRDVCMHRYRYWNGSQFVYTDATCPYTGSNYFDEENNSTLLPEEDRCSKSLTGCKLRFGDHEPLYTTALPGIKRFGN